MQVFVPYKYLYLFDEPRTAHVSFEGNANASYNCNIISHNAKLIHREDDNYFIATATVSTQGQICQITHEKDGMRIISSGTFVLYYRIKGVSYKLIKIENRGI